MPETATARVLDFVRRLGRPDITKIPKVPPVEQSFPSGHALFMDEHEREIMYQMPWPHRGLPHDDRNRMPGITWIIEGQYFNPARRDEHGNWIFRRCEK